MQLTKKAIRRQTYSNDVSARKTSEEIFNNYRAAGELVPLTKQWPAIMLENIPEGMPKRNRTFQLFEELRDLDMQWEFLLNPGPLAHSRCARHG